MEKIEGLSIDLDLDTLKLDRGLTGLKDKLRTVNSEMKKNMSAFDRSDKSVEKYETRLQGLNKKLEVQKQVTKEAKAEYEKMIKEHGEGSKQAEKAARQYNNQAAALNNLERYVERTKHELKELKKQQAVADSNWTKAGKGLTNFGNKLGGISSAVQDVGKNLTKRLTLPAVGAATALGSIALVKGFDRLTGIDNAQAKLKGLGHDAESVETIMSSALEAVKGTAHGMDEAATTAASAVAAGIKPGKDLTRYLSLTGDAAAIAGTSMSEMGSIINQVQTSQVAYTDNLNQLSDRGIPIYQWLGEEAGVAASEVKNMASEGKISSEMFLNAIEKNIGGAAQKMGAESFTAGISNMWAAVGRLGASFLDAGGKGGGFFSQMKPLIGDLTSNIDSMGDVAERWGVKFGEMFAGLVDKIKSIKASYDELSPTIQDIIKKVALVGSAVAVSIGPILTIAGTIGMFASNVSKGFGVISTAIGKVVGPVGGLSKWIGGLLKKFSFLSRFLSVLTGPIGWIIGGITLLGTAFMTAYKKSETFREGVNKIIDSVKNAFAKVKEFIEGIKGLFHDDGQSGRDILASLGFSDKFIEAVDFIALKLSRIRGFVINFIDGIKGLFKDDGQGGRDLLSSIGISDKMIAVLDGIALKIVLFRDNVKKAFGAAADFVKNTWSGLTSWFSSTTGTMVDKTVGIFGSIKDGVSTGIQTSVDFVKNIWGGLINWWNQKSDGILTKATSIFNSVKSNVSTAISAVVSYAMDVWSQLTAFWDKHGDMILQATQNVWSGIKTVVLFVTGVVWTGIKNFATGIYTVIKFALDNILAGWSVVWPHIEKIALGAIKVLWNGAKTIFPYIVAIIRTSMSVISKIMSFVWPAVKFIIVETWNAIKGTIDGALKVITGLIQFFSALFTGNWTEMWNAVKKILSGAVQFIWNFVQVSFFGRIIKGGMLFIKSFAGLFTTMWGGIRSVFSTVISWIVGFVKNSFTRMSNTIGSITQTTRNIISTIWNAILSFFRTIISGIVNFVRNRFVSMRDTINSITSVTRDLISKLWNNIFEFFRTVISGIVNFVRTRFTNMKNNISNLFAGIRDLTQRIWNGIKNNIVNPVKNAVDTGLSRFRSFRDRVTEIFTKIKDNVSSRVTDMIDNVKAMPGKMKDGIVKGAGAVKEGMLTVARKMVDGLASGVNGVISGIDWVLDKLKAPTLDYEFKPSSAFSWYAKGTDGHPGGHAVLGDGTGDNSGSELTLLPNGKAFMSADKPTLYPNLPKGTQVISAKNTRKLFDSIPMYNSGKGRLNSAISKGKGIFNWGKEKVTSAVSKVKEWTGNVFDYIKKPGELLNIAIDKLGIKLPDIGVIGDIAKGGFKYVKNKAVNFIKNKLTGFFDGGSVAAPTGKGVSRWKNVILQAAAAMGEKITGAELNGILAQIQRESGGNEKIIQSSAVWDVNTAAGNPARGLLQYIPQTFNAYKVKGHGNIYSGYDQLLAFFNNKTWRRDLPYGRRGWGPRGGRKYKDGTDSHVGGNAILGDGMEYEPFLLPDGRMGLSPNIPTLFNNLPTGTKVWPNIKEFESNRRTEAMKLLALAGKEIQGNKRPNQLPGVSGNGGSDDNRYLETVVDKLTQQVQLLTELVISNRQIADKPVLSEGDIRRAYNRHDTVEYQKNLIFSGRPR